MTNENGNGNNVERQVLELIATDRVDIPISSMSGRLKRAKPKLAKAIDLSPRKSFKGNRAYARVETGDTSMKARTMREAVDEFAAKYTRHGKILNGLIEEKRAAKETHLVFGMYEECRLTSNDYMGVMTSLGFSEATAERFYPELMTISRNLSRRKSREGEERSILVG